MRVMLWGGRSKARIIMAMVDEIYEKKASIVGIFDKTINEIPFATGVNLYNNSNALKELCGDATHFVICIGGEHGYARYKISEMLIERGLKPLSLISEYGLLDKLEGCGHGVQVMPGAIVHKFSTLGHQCILNTNSTVDHECVLGNGVHVMGGASIAGRVIVGDFSTIGTNATVLPNVKIGKNVFIGAGAVVTKDIEANSVVSGVPARRVKAFIPSFDFGMFE